MPYVRGTNSPDISSFESFPQEFGKLPLLNLIFHNTIFSFSCIRILKLFSDLFNFCFIYFLNSNFVVFLNGYHIKINLSWCANFYSICVNLKNVQTKQLKNRFSYTNNKIKL